MAHPVPQEPESRSFLQAHNRAADWLRRAGIAMQVGKRGSLVDETAQSPCVMRSIQTVRRRANPLKCFKVSCDSSTVGAKYGWRNIVAERARTFLRMNLAVAYHPAEPHCLCDGCLDNFIILERTRCIVGTSANAWANTWRRLSGTTFRRRTAGSDRIACRTAVLSTCQDGRTQLAPAPARQPICLPYIIRYVRHRTDAILQAV